MHHPR